MVLNIKEKDVRFGLGLYFLGKCLKEFDTDLNGLLKSLVKNPISDMVDLMYFSAKCEAEIDGIKLELTKREFLEHLEATKDFQNTEGLLATWSNAFVESIKGNFLPETKEEEGEVKKK